MTENPRAGQTTQLQKNRTSVVTPTPRSLVFLFALASGLSVANVYYAQPLLDSLAHEFNISYAAIGGVITATQVGCAISLLFLVPLGDKVERRRLMAWQLVALVGALIAVGAAHHFLILLLGMLAVGLLGTAMTQGLIAYAASAADSSEQGRVVGVAQSGVFIGLLLARLFAGVVNDFGGWRNVYFLSAFCMLVIAVPLWMRLPRLTNPSSHLSYGQLMKSMMHLLGSDKVLQVRGCLALLMFASFSVFWSALVLPLSAPPHSLSHTWIGAFGLVGVAGALAAARAGQWADKGYAQRTSAAALLALLVAWWPLSLMEWSYLALVVGIFFLDLGGQALHVTNQSMIFKTHPEANSRLIGLYMIFYAIGSGIGGISTTATYAYAGWGGVCLLGAMLSLVAMVFWWLTRQVGTSQK